MDFHDGHHEGHLGFWLGTILPIFDLQVTPMFHVNWPFSPGEEAKYRLSRWWPSWISNLTDFRYF